MEIYRYTISHHFRNGSETYGLQTNLSPPQIQKIWPQFEDGSDVLTPEFKKIMESLGIEYEPEKGEFINWEEHDDMLWHEVTFPEKST